MTMPSSDGKLGAFSFAEGEVALVTGGGGILGRKFCQALASSGLRVAVADISPASAAEVADEIGKLAIPISCDVSDPSSVDACVGTLIDRFGRVDVLVNNAATKTSDPRQLFAPFDDFSLDTWREVMAVNIDGMFLMAQSVGRHMVKQGGGRIVQLSSIYGLVGPDERIYEGSHYLGGPINTPAVYSASKAAVVGLTRWLATHWASSGIRVNCLVPGGVESGQNETFIRKYSKRVPLGRMAHPDEMTGALLFLASESSSYVTGQVLAVDGGWTAW